MVLDKDIKIFGIIYLVKLIREVEMGSYFVCIYDFSLMVMVFYTCFVIFYFIKITIGDIGNYFGFVHNLYLYACGELIVVDTYEGFQVKTIRMT